MSSKPDEALAAREALAQHDRGVAVAAYNDGAHAALEAVKEWLPTRDKAVVEATIAALSAAGRLRAPQHEQALVNATVRALAESGALRNGVPDQVEIVGMPERKHEVIRDPDGMVVGSFETDRAA